eukprot:5997317-Prymnesium_polylepis.1
MPSPHAARTPPRRAPPMARTPTGRRVARAPDRARRLENLTMDNLRVALATSLASDDPLEFCYATLGFYTARAAIRAKDIFVLDMTSGHSRFRGCYAAFGVTQISDQDYPTGQSDYASRMQTSDTLKRRWYSTMQGRMLRLWGYHFTIFVDVSTRRFTEEALTRTAFVCVDRHVARLSD